MSKNEQLSFLNQLQWEIHPKVVLQLGETLIEDDTSALLELIKNSYDADASFCVVDINSRITEHGMITIEDDGNGMTFDDIKNGWLTISNSLKADQKRKKILTKKNRTPVGDKGLGRLSVQALGKEVTIETCADGEEYGHRFSINWDMFRTTDKLSNIKVNIDRIEKRKGTKISISSLANLEYWSKDKNIKKVQRGLSQLLFPMGSYRSFDVIFTVDGDNINLAEVTEGIKNTANIRVKFNYNGSFLYVSANYKLSSLEPNTLDAKDDYNNYIIPDKGASFFSYLIEKNRSLNSYLTYEGQNGWFLSYNNIYDYSFLESNPGPFNGEIESYSLSSSSEFFETKTHYSDFIKSLSGIRVYRDGFGIKPYGFDGNDWLKLGQQQTSGKSFYGLRPLNTIGYVNITAADNNQLQEVTAREGFLRNSYYDNFCDITSKVIHEIQNTTTILRRTFNEFRLHRNQNLNISKRASMAAIPESLRSVANKSISIEKSISQVSSNLKNASSKLEIVYKEVEMLEKNTYPSEVKDVVSRATHLSTEAKVALSRAEHIVKDLLLIIPDSDELNKQAAYLDQKISIIEEQIEGLTELAGIGLATESLIHELYNITKEVIFKLKGEKTINSFTQSFIVSSLSSIQKQMSYLTPALRYKREVIECFSIMDFIKTISHYYRARLEREGINLNIKLLNDFKVTANKGRINQVLENLIINSQYWFKSPIAKNLISSSEIYIEVDKPYIYLYDSGQGIDPSIEDFIFDPFITKKPPGEGRGLGLYVSRELLRYIGCQISLLPKRNLYKRRYIFEIDLSGVIRDGHTTS